MTNKFVIFFVSPAGLEIDTGGKAILGLAVVVVAGVVKVAGARAVPVKLELKGDVVDVKAIVGGAVTVVVTPLVVFVVDELFCWLLFIAVNCVVADIVVVDE